MAFSGQRRVGEGIQKEAGRSHVLRAACCPGRPAEGQPWAAHSKPASGLLSRTPLGSAGTSSKLGRSWEPLISLLSYNRPALCPLRVPEPGDTEALENHPARSREEGAGSLRVTPKYSSSY